MNTKNSKQPKVERIILGRKDSVSRPDCFRNGDPCKVYGRDVLMTLEEAINHVRDIEVTGEVRSEAGDHEALQILIAHADALVWCQDNQARIDTYSHGVIVMRMRMSDFAMVAGKGSDLPSAVRVYQNMCEENG